MATATQPASSPADVLASIEDQVSDALGLLNDVMFDILREDDVSFCVVKALKTEGDTVGGALLLRNDWNPHIPPAVGDSVFLPSHFGSETVVERLVGRNWTTLILDTGFLFGDAVEVTNQLNFERKLGWNIVWVGGWLLDEIAGTNLRAVHELLQRSAPLPFMPFGRLMKSLGLLQCRQPAHDAVGFDDYETIPWGIPRPTSRQFAYAKNLQIPLRAGMTKDELRSAISAAVDGKPR